jgi:hypothetical protein
MMLLLKSLVIQIFMCTDPSQISFYLRPYMNFPLSPIRGFTDGVKIQYGKLNNKSYWTVLIFSYIDLYITKYSFLKAMNCIVHVGHKPSTGFAENWESYWKLSDTSNLKTHWLVINSSVLKWINSLRNNNNNKLNMHNKTAMLVSAVSHQFMQDGKGY